MFIEIQNLSNKYKFTNDLSPEALATFNKLTKENNKNNNKQINSKDNV